MIIHPKNKYVMVTLPEKGDKVLSSGIILPESAAPMAETAKVIGVDPEVTTVKDGQTILVKSYTISEIEIEGKKYGFVKEEDIIAVQE